jgi:hypothetical protein
MADGKHTPEGKLESSNKPLPFYQGQKSITDMDPPLHSRKMACYRLEAFDKSKKINCEYFLTRLHNGKFLSPKTRILSLSVE